MNAVFMLMIQHGKKTLTEGKAHKFLTAFLIYHFLWMNEKKSDAEKSNKRENLF